jgi:hypothetical protein
MSKKSVTVLTYHRHKLLDLVIKCILMLTFLDRG